MFYPSKDNFVAYLYLLLLLFAIYVYFVFQPTILDPGLEKNTPPRTPEESIWFTLGFLIIMTIWFFYLAGDKKEVVVNDTEKHS